MNKITLGPYAYLLEASRRDYDDEFREALSEIEKGVLRNFKARHAKFTVKGKDAWMYTTDSDGDSQEITITETGKKVYKVDIVTMEGEDMFIKVKKNIALSSLAKEVIYGAQQFGSKDRGWKVTEEWV